MGTTLTGTTPQDTYDSLIKVTNNGPLSSTARYLSDGLGNDSALALSTSRVGVGTSSPAYILDTRGIAATFNAGIDGVLQPTLYLGHPSYTTTYLNKISTSVSAAPQGQLMQFSVGNGASTYADVMTLNGLGNVGIGTSSPSYKLDVSGISSSNTGFLISSGQYDNIGQTPYTGMFMTGSSSTDGFGALLLTSRTDLARPIIFGTSNGSISVERVRIDANGLKFNGDTAAANALDDYEEGTWTPSLIFSGGSTGITYTTQAGKYVKIGSKVSVNCYVVLSNKGSSTGSARIDGLPFTVPNAAGNYSPAIVLLDGGITYTGQAQGFANINSTSVALGNVTEAGSATALTDTNFSNSSAIMISLTYLVS